MTKKDNSFEDDVQCMLHGKNFDSVLQHLKNPENDSFVSNNVWNLINTVCFTLKNNNSLLQDDSDFGEAKHILLYLVGRGNPKEVLIALLEGADSFKSHAFFSLMLEPIKQALIKAPGKRGKSLEWVLSTLNAHIKTLDVPKNLDLQEEEKLLLDVTPAVIDSNYVLSNYFNFLEPFVMEVSYKNTAGKKISYSDRIQQQREVLCKYILLLFNQPLLFHDLHVKDSTRPKSRIRIICEKYIKLLSEICHNIFKLYKYDNNISPCNDKTKDISIVLENDEVPVLAFSNLSYLIFVENTTLEFQSFVHSHQYTFLFHLKYIIALLSKVENLVIFKGLKLAHILLERLQECELNYDCLELVMFTKLPMALFSVAVNCEIEVHRNSAVKMFLIFMSKCDSQAKYHIIMQVLSNVKHSGAEGLVIGLYKNYLHDHIMHKTSNSYFLGKNLNQFLKEVFVLKDGVETDILENSDKIISALNFLRYLLLSDKKEVNCTGIWDFGETLVENFLKPLQTGIDLSRAHYEQASKDAKIASMQKQLNVNTTLSVNNESLPNIHPGIEKEVFTKALVTFDMIESILSRVNELLY